LFDWDNTLVDNWPSINAALNAALVAFGQAPWTLDETKARVRRSMRETFPEMFGERWKDARGIFYRTFGERHLDQLSPLPGSGAMLESLAATGVYLGVVSNKSGPYLRKEAEFLGWTGYFGRLVGAGDAARDKPAPDPVALALETSGVAPGPAVVFVGDTGVDIACARNAGCIPVLIEHGTPLEEEIPDAASLLRVSGWEGLRGLLGIR